MHSQINIRCFSSCKLTRNLKFLFFLTLVTFLVKISCLLQVIKCAIIINDLDIKADFRLWSFDKILDEKHKLSFSTYIFFLFLNILQSILTNGVFNSIKYFLFFNLFNLIFFL